MKNPRISIYEQITNLTCFNLEKNIKLSIV